MNNKVLMPLCNFKLEIEHESLDLDNNSRIINIKNIDNGILSNISGAFNKSKFCNGWNCEYFLESNSHSNEAPRRNMDRCITILKLFKDDFIFSGVVYSYSNNRLDILRHYNPYMHYTYNTNEYTIFENDEKKLKDFWSQSFEEMPYTTLFPLYRFNLADYRVYSMESFVDYVESLEGILVPDRDQISKKFQERGAFILSLEDRSGSINYKKKLRAAYDCRSIIVHGKKEMNKIEAMSKDDWINPIKKIRNYNRRILKFIIFEKLFDYETRKQRMKKIFDQPKSNCC